jgi:transcriptional regulator with XRE-family HTH domain
MVSDREKLIGSRLRAFRETLQIPRARFAVAIGFGSERIASIEAGRAPLRYEVFQAVSRRYQLSPYWLAEAIGSPKHGGAFDDTRLAKEVHPRALFSEVYDRFIGGGLKKAQVRSLEMWQKIKLGLSKWDAFLELTMGDALVRERYGPIVVEQAQAIESLLAKMRADLSFRQAVRSKLPKQENKLLTETESAAKFPPVKLQLKNLRTELNRLTEESGKKTELAGFLGAPLASVSRWLSGEREPGGETTLKMLRWVQEQESQPNAPGSVTSTAKGKTQLRSSKVYEKTKSNPHKG